MRKSVFLAQAAYQHKPLPGKRWAHYRDAVQQAVL
jgi:hypothetical protein